MKMRYFFSLQLTMLYGNSRANFIYYGHSDAGSAMRSEKNLGKTNTSFLLEIDNWFYCAIARFHMN